MNALTNTIKNSDYDTVIDIKDKHVYPGFIAVNSTLGLMEIGSVRATEDFEEIGTYNPNVRSIIAYNTDSKITPTIRTNGVLIAQVTPRGGIISGFTTLMQQAPDHFHMVMDKPNGASSQEYIDKYMILPGIAMYAAGQWILNLNYWGCNQYITQRALGADLPTARKGILFAALLKLLMPVIVMLPGIAAYVLHKNGHLDHLVGGMDGAYSAVLAFLPTGIKGLSLAALTAAIVASLAGKSNSISTIFTLDIYKKYFAKEASEEKLVWMGRWVVICAMCISVLFTWDDILGIGGAGGFTFIQKYTGFISPGVLVVFVLGMFWKRTTGTAAIVGILGGFILSLFYNEFAPMVFGNETFYYTAYPNSAGVYKIPFLVAMGIAGIITAILMVVITLFGPKVNPKAFVSDKSMYKVDNTTLVLIVSILMILSALYIKFW